jgi:hypothetical protein
LGACVAPGTGFVFLLRWFWWRINAWTEIAAMVISFALAVAFSGGLAGLHWWTPGWDASGQLVASVAITTAGWLLVTFLTRPADMATLQRFVRKIRPQGRGWNAVRKSMEVDAVTTGDGSLSAAALSWFLACVAIYAAVFGVGYLVYGQLGLGVAVLLLALAAAAGVLRLLPKVDVR